MSEMLNSPLDMQHEGLVMHVEKHGLPSVDGKLPAQTHATSAASTAEVPPGQAGTAAVKGVPLEAAELRRLNAQDLAVFLRQPGQAAWLVDAFERARVSGLDVANLLKPVQPPQPAPAKPPQSASAADDICLSDMVEDAESKDGTQPAQDLYGPQAFRRQLVMRFKTPTDSKKRPYNSKTWYGLLNLDDFGGFQEMIRNDPNLLRDRDQCGATPLQLLVLKHTEPALKIAQEIIQQQPELCTDEYTGEMYKGETLLHMAIIKRSLEMVKLLVTICPDKLLGKRATGKFFNPSSGPCYYGELPLAFAVCTNQPEMVRVLLNAGADLTLQDEANGNNAAHMAVLFNLPEMYDLLRAEWNARKQSGKVECLTDRPNKFGQGCLALAAAEGRREIFEHVLRSRSTVHWSYGQVVCLHHPTEGLDEGLHCSEGMSENKKSLPGQPDTGAMEIKSAMSEIQRLGRYELLASPYIQQLLARKWDAFGRDMWVRRLLKHLLVLAVLLVAVTLPRPSVAWDSAGGLLSSTRGQLLRLCCECALTVHAVHKLRIEVKELWKERWGTYFGMGGAMALENCASLAYCTSTICAPALRFVLGATHMADAALALASFACWLYLAFFLLGVKITGPTIVMVMEMICTDIPAFLLVVSTFVGAFATSVHILSGKTGMQSLVDGFNTCMYTVVDSFDEDHFQDTYGQWPLLGRALITLYLTMVVLVMMNLLIAKMGDTFNNMTERAELIWLLNRSRVLSAIEKEMSEEERKRAQNEICASDRFGRLCFELVQVDADRWKEEGLEIARDRYNEVLLQTAKSEQLQSNEGLMTVMDDHRCLYVNPKGVAGVARLDQYTNTDPLRRVWKWCDQSGILSLADGRQLYADHDGWVYAATEGSNANTEATRRKWAQNEEGVVSLADGQQLYVNLRGWVAVAQEGEFTNRDAQRRTWSMVPEAEVADALEWNLLEHGVLLMLGDGRCLYVNPENVAGMGRLDQYTNTDPLRRVWKWCDQSGILSLADGRQLYADHDGWVYAAKEGSVWAQNEAGVFSLADGRQLHVDSEGWVLTAFEGQSSNRESWRRSWTLLPMADLWNLDCSPRLS